MYRTVLYLSFTANRLLSHGHVLNFLHFKTPSCTMVVVGVRSYNNQHFIYPESFPYICDAESIAVAPSSAGVTESCFCSTKVSEHAEIT